MEADERGRRRARIWRAHSASEPRASKPRPYPTVPNVLAFVARISAPPPARSDPPSPIYKGASTYAIARLFWSIHLRDRPSLLSGGAVVNVSVGDAERGRELPRFVLFCVLGISFETSEPRAPPLLLKQRARRQERASDFQCPRATQGTCLGALLRPGSSTRLKGRRLGRQRA